MHREPGTGLLSQPPSRTYRTQSYVGLCGTGWTVTHLGTRAPSPLGISLHPLGFLVFDRGSDHHGLGTALPLGSTPSLGASHPLESCDLSLKDDELATGIQRPSIAETELRLVQWDMTRVPGLPAGKSEDPPAERQSFKRRTGPTPRNGNNFPAMPLNHVCSDSIEDILLVTIWNTYSKWVETYYRFPMVDFDRYFPNPVLPDSASDKFAANRGTALFNLINYH